MRFLPALFLSLSLALASFAQQPNIDNYLDIAALFKESGEYEKALAVLGGISPGSSERAAKYLGRLYFLEGRAKEAVSVLSSIKDKDWLVFLYSGLAREELGEPDSAAESYLQSLKLKKNSIALLRLAKIYRTHQPKKAVKFLRKLINFDPSIRLAYYYLGEAYLGLGQNKQAYKYLSKAQSFYPEAEAINEKFLAVKKALGEEFFAEKKRKKQEARKSVKPPLYKPVKDIPLIKVGLAQGLDEFIFSCGAGFIITCEDNSFKGEANKFYKVSLKDKKLAVNAVEEEQVYEFSGPLQISSLEYKGKKGSFYVLDIIYSKGEFWHKRIDRAYRGDLKAVISGGKIDLINSLSAKEYLYGVLPAEISRLAGQESLKAQAVAARTYIFKNLNRHKKEGFNFCSDVHCQVYKGILGEFFTTNQAIEATSGLIMALGDKPIEAFYHSNCGGCLGSDVFNTGADTACRLDSADKGIPDSPYQEEQWFLKEAGAFCSDELEAKNRWQRVYDSEDFVLAFGFKLKDLKAIKPVEKGRCFRYKKINVASSNGTEALSTSLKIRGYFDNLKSSAFKVETAFSSAHEPKMLFFWGAGFGHGAGLCQQGAMKMAEQSYSWQQILKHYYSDAELKNIYKYYNQ